MANRFESLNQMDEVVEKLDAKAQEVEEFTEQLLSKMDVEYSKVRESYIEAKRLETENEVMDNKCAGLEQSIREKKAATVHFQQISEDLDLELPILRAEHANMLAQCENAKRRQEPIAEDKRILKEIKLKLRLYKELSNVKLDYTRTESEPLRGYVRNKQSGYMKTFTLKGADLDAQREELWNDYVTPATEDWTSSSPTYPTQD